jgi:hypothetical protein
VQRARATRFLTIFEAQFFTPKSLGLSCGLRECGCTARSYRVSPEIGESGPGRESQNALSM